ncbi:unnamed protein product [Somion occarium]|uniref:G-patch domain-containing protein n=1 Tax=Somion occarium TaxID=3059160 RepID=A0ABP1DNW9_9APHY
MSNSPGPAKVSFTIRRPTPVSRASSTGADSDSSFKLPALPRHLTNGASTPGSPLARSAPASPKPSRARTYHERDSSEEEEEIQDELVTGFDQFGVQRLYEKKKPEGPLVIPPLKNKDWRELARKRKSLYVPPSAIAATGADGSVGGLGTKDTIQSGPQLAGLQLKKRVKLEESTGVKMEVEQDGVNIKTEVSAVSTSLTETVEEVKLEQETEDQKALRAILAGVTDEHANERQIDIIPAVISEDDAFKQDVVELPEPATLEDYERVPVSQFGAALLRGMGWKEGTAASKRKGADGKEKGLVEPWLPQARPALLGIGAKEKQVYDDGSGKGKKGGKKARPERKYMPILKVEKPNGDDSRHGSEERGSRSGSSSRRRSPSPSYSSSRKVSRRSPSPDRRRDRERDRYGSDYDRSRRDEYREKDKDRERSRDRERDRRRDDESSSSRRDRDRDSDRRRDRRDY